MSNNRYARLQELQLDTFLMDCPVEIEKGALLLDTQTKAVILQLRLNLLTNNQSEISSVTITIEGLDDVGDEIPGINSQNYIFRDINLIRERSFGDKTPILLNSNVRRAKVRLEKVTFVDGNIWRYSGGEFNTPKQKAISTLRRDLLEQLNRDISALPEKVRNRFKYIPQKLGDYWLCACGRPNNNNKGECCRCGITKNWLFNNITEENIQKNLDSYKEVIRLREEKLEETRKIEEKNRIRRNKRNNKIKIALLIIMGLGVTILLFFYVALPFIQYSQASTFLSQNKYDPAISLFETLGDYKDSKNMIIETKYQKAQNYFSIGDFDNSIAVFKTIVYYKNSEEMINEAFYQKGLSFLKSKQYDLSITFFSSLNGYKDSNEMVNEANFLKANDFLSNKQYDKAINVFSNIKDYKNSNELINEAKYLNANDVLANKQYDYAIKIFSDIKDYKNSNELKSEAYYRKANDLLSLKQYDEAIALFIILGDYKNSRELYQEANYQVANDLIANQDTERAIPYLSKILDYKDSNILINKIYYSQGIQLLNNKQWQSGIDTLKKVDPKIYPDVDELVKKAQVSFNEDSYLTAKQKASSGDYASAYYLLVNLNYKDSVNLAKKYDELAFGWSFVGGMTKKVYDFFDTYTFNGILHGGKPGESVDLSVKWTLTDGSIHTETVYGKRNLESITSGVSYNDPYSWQLWVPGQCEVIISTLQTKKVLAIYYFSLDIYVP